MEQKRGVRDRKGNLKERDIGLKEGRGRLVREKKEKEEREIGATKIHRSSRERWEGGRETQRNGEREGGEVQGERESVCVYLSVRAHV